MKRLFPWIHARKRSEPDVPYDTPIPLGNKSNGEFFHEQTPHERRLRKLILETCDEKARYLGMDRRDFIASTMGMAATLSIINAVSGCGSENGDKKGAGGYCVPDDAITDAAVANAVLCADGEFILDLQTHHIEDEAHWRVTHPNQTYPGDTVARLLTFYGCPDIQTDPSACVDSKKYIEAIFLDSPTTVAVLSGFPGAICDDGTMCMHPISNEDMVNSRNRVNEAARSQRMVQHCQIVPNDRWDLQAAEMEKIHGTHGNSGWKLYPSWPGSTGTGWWLDDAATAYPLYDKAIELGEPLICVHKGLKLPGFLDEFLDPKDVGPAAVAYPQISFVIYHSAVDLAFAEGPYDPNTPTALLTGMDRLIRTVETHGLKDKNVYAEMGTAWLMQMSNPIAAQHYVGKALKYIGLERLVWGSECVWFNSPRPQIEAFRTFEISQEFQDTYGYPALTKDLKDKIFGRTAATLYGINPDEERRAIDVSKLALMRRDIDGEVGGRRWMFQPLNGPRTRREFANLWKWRKFTETI